MNETHNRQPLLLILTSQLPYPPHQGATIRSHNLIRELAKRSEIDLLSFVSRKDEIEEAKPLRELCRHVEGELAPVRPMKERAWSTFTTIQPDMALRFASEPFRALLARYLEAYSYDAILFVGIDMGPYLEYVASWRKALPREVRRARLIFDDLNAEYVLQRRAFQTDVRHLANPRRWAGALYSLIQWPKLRRYEARLCRLADDVVAVSEADAEVLRRLAPGRRVTVVPNGVDLECYQPLPEGSEPVVPPPSLVFTGKMDFRPNVDAACWFADDVFPTIRAQVPAATFAIVGRDPHPRIQALADRPGVVVTGYVPDDRPYFNDATLYVVPLRVGGGTRLKVLSAMAMEKAIVSTSLGSEGLGVRTGRELIIADTAQEFASYALKLLEDDARRKALGRQARRFVEARYDWSAIAPLLEGLYAR